MRTIELLAPARNAEPAIAAIDHGADAVYIGAPSHGARHAASNSIDDIRRVTEYAHRFGVKIYVTLNTLVYDSEIEGVRKLVKELYRAGVDALIIQDMGLTDIGLPPIALHASTQCDITTPAKALWLQNMGMSQLVLARELTLGEINDIKAVTSVPLEAFVHGALCVSYSGNCQASQAFNGRSANRGECAQICRLSYDLIDGNGDIVIHDKHLLSLKDMNRIEHLEQMINAGISSFKIEGRLKDVGYVKNTVAAYRRALDEIIASSHGELIRASHGTSALTFEPDVARSFNRGFTDYFLHDREFPGNLASFETPKNAGARVGTVKYINGKTITCNLSETINNGDGLCYFDAGGKLTGFRVNRADGARLTLLQPVDIHPGTILYRNRDTEKDAILSRKTATRTLPLKMRFRIAPDGKRAVLHIQAPALGEITVVCDATVDMARNDATESRRAHFSRLGNTIYTLDAYRDDSPEKFVPASDLSKLKKLALEALESTLRATYRYCYYQSPSTVPAFYKDNVVYSDNVANRAAQKLYLSAGVKNIEPALEVKNKDGRFRVMNTRYCLRRELGMCLKTPGGKNLKAPLTLKSGRVEMDIEFDCAKCEMSLYRRGR